MDEFCKDPDRCLGGIKAQIEGLECNMNKLTSKLNGCMSRKVSPKLFILFVSILTGIFGWFFVKFDTFGNTLHGMDKKLDVHIAETHFNGGHR